MITVRLFSVLREDLGTDQLQLSTEEAPTTDDLLDVLRVKYPLLQSKKIAVAVNEQYVRENHPLNDGDEVALLTPVSGG